VLCVWRRWLLEAGATRGCGLWTADRISAGLQRSKKRFRPFLHYRFPFHIRWLQGKMRHRWGGKIAGGGSWRVASCSQESNCLRYLELRSSILPGSFKSLYQVFCQPERWHHLLGLENLTQNEWQSGTCFPPAIPSISSGTLSSPL
jgi:hypothetical protein